LKEGEDLGKENEGFWGIKKTPWKGLVVRNIDKKKRGKPRMWQNLGGLWGIKKPMSDLQTTTRKVKRVGKKDQKKRRGGGDD